MSGKPFFVDYDKRGQAKCKKCKQKIEKGSLRIARVVANPFTDDGGEMKQWHHVDCLFESFNKARATTKKIDDPLDDIDGWQDMDKDGKECINQKIKEYYETRPKTPVKPKRVSKENISQSPLNQKGNQPSPSSSSNSTSAISLMCKDSDKGHVSGHKDDLFKEFRKLCAKIAEESSYLEKTRIVSEYLQKGTDEKSFKGDLRLWVRLLLPGVVKRIYNIQSRQMTKLFSQLFGTSQEEMLEDLEKGDIAETVRVFFESSRYIKPAKKSTLTLQEVDKYLTELEGLTTEESQMSVLKKVSSRSSGNDLKMFVRLLKGDLRINAGAKHILEGVHKSAYEAFQTTRNLDSVLDEVLSSGGVAAGKEKGLNIQAKIMTPVLPMLAEPCRSVAQAFKKCPNGLYAEIKYDGERVQVHKRGREFKYFSRSLKPVMDHKVAHFKDCLPEAFPTGNDLIIDSEILLIDNKTGVPLPFGTLGKHKKEKFTDANVCLFVFDCIHLNGKNLLDCPIVERRRVLEENFRVVKNRVVLSEMKEVHAEGQLRKMIDKVLGQGLEGLVLKDLKSVYEPGKRHWLKVKKDYLKDGSMADSADLVVLGAWYGTGKKGGMMSVFLMGCFDHAAKKWCTVTKVHTGHDDAALERLQTELRMRKISQNQDMAPAWLKCNRSMVPDFVAEDPKNCPVWEISGAEFTKNQIHTADGISVRFPRVTKERPDKTWKEATDLSRLKKLYELSKEHDEVTGLGSGSDDELATPSPSGKKRGKRVSSPATETEKVSRTSDENTNFKKKRKELSICDQDFKVPVFRPLPSFFEGVRCYVPTKTKDLTLLKRYILAYAGEVADNPQDHSITHTVVLPKMTKGKEIIGERVGVDWLWDSIKLQELQPVFPYRIS